MLERKYIYEENHEPEYLDYIGISRVERIGLYIKDGLAILRKTNPVNGGYWPSDIAIGQKLIELSLNIND
jgi:hypothetical protein